MIKKVILALILILAAAAAVYFVYDRFFREPAGAGEDKVLVQSVRSLQNWGGYGNRYSGVVETQKTSNIEFSPDRKQEELFVAEGDHVKVGDELFSYDTESISLEIDQLNLEIERLSTNVNNNTAQIERLSADLEKVSDTDRLDYSAQISQLQAEIAQEQYDIRTKQAEIEKKQTSIDNSSVCADLEGTITKIADVNAIIAGSNYDASGNPSNVYISILADGNLRIRGRISETNIYEIQPGDRMTVRSRVDADQTWEGTISSIDTQHTDTDKDSAAIYGYSSGESATKYSFYVEPDNTEGLMLGQHVILECLDESASLTEEGIWLNSGWIVTEDSASYVWAAASEGAPLEKRAVTTGRYLEETDQYEIVSGLDAKEFLAWPDESCRVGAPTASEYSGSETDYTTPGEAQVMVVTG